MPGGYAEKGYFMSHNVFLDYGRSSGIPGMLLFAWFFFWPAVRVYRQGLVVPYMPFLLAHFAFLVFFVSLSFLFYKAFWGFWMLMAVAAVQGPALAIAGSRSKVRSRSRNGVHSGVRPNGRSGVPQAPEVLPVSRIKEIGG
jgi:O-antigen ligase